MGAAATSPDQVPTSATATDGAAWHDPKRYWWLLGLAVPLLPFGSARMADRTGLDIFWWWAPFVVFVIIPLIDWLRGTDESNPPESAVPALEADRYYRVATYLFIPLQFAGLIWACSQWTSGDLSWFASLGLAISVGTVAGIAINTAHELGHKRPALERWLSKVSLSQSLYGHFFIEHNRGHHTRVSTPEDPASSRFGETFWEFWPRTVWGSLRSAVELEQERSQRLGRSFWSPRNDVLNAWAMSVVLFGGLVAVFGASILPWLVIQAVFGFSLLEVVNYLEHYGLMRQRRADGRYERTRPEHSWNSNNVATNLFLYQLQRHSDHHANPTRRYQSLRHFPDAPQLPTGYAGMILAAYVPPLWRRIMDRRVIEHYGGDLTLANMHPRNREAMMQRYAAECEQARAAASAA